MARRFDRLGWAMDQTDLTPPQRFVLLILADTADEFGKCWPSRRLIQARTGYGLTAVKDALRSLAEQGVIKTVPSFTANGRQTSNSYFLCLAGRGRVATPPEDMDGLEEYPRVAADDPSPVGSRPPVEPLSRTNSKKTSSTTSTTSSSRRASRRRGAEEGGWVDPTAAVFAEEQEDDPDPAPTRGRGPDSAWSLNGYFRDKVFVAGKGRLGDTNDAAMRKFFADAKRQGIPAEVLRIMVDEFVEDDRLFSEARSRWRVFISNAARLQESAQVTFGVREITGGADDTPKFGGAIPQSVLDAVLSKYPEEASA